MFNLKNITIKEIETMLNDYYGADTMKAEVQDIEIRDNDEVYGTIINHKAKESTSCWDFDIWYDKDDKLHIESGEL